MSKEKIKILENKLQLEVKKREELENVLQEKQEEILEVNANLSKLIDNQTQELESIFENIIDAYVLMDLYGNVLKMNKAAIDFFEYDCNKEPFNVTKIIYEKDTEYAFDSFSKLQTVGYFKDYKARIYTKSKKVKWVQINAKTVNDKDGKPTFAHGIVRDISNTVKQNLLFENQKKLLDVIINNSPLGIVLADNKKRFIKTNNAFQKMLGYSEEELKKLTITDISAKNNNEKIDDQFSKLTNNELNSFSTVKEYVSKTNDVVISKINISAVKNKNSSLKYLIGFIEDITEESKREEILEFLNGLMSSILGKTDKTEISFDISQKIIDLLGFDVCEIVFYNKNKQILNYLSTKFGEEFADLEDANERGIVAIVAKTGEPIICNDVSKDDRYISAYPTTKSEITVPIIYNDEVIGIINGESSQTNFFTKEHLKTLTTIANVIGTKLNSAISLEQKLNAEKEKGNLLRSLTKTNKELKDFAHIVSHDLKSPLRSMNAVLNWLQEDCESFLNESMRSQFDLLFRKIDKMDLLINGILSYASVDKVDRNVVTIDLNTIVKEVLEDIPSPSDKITVNKKTTLPKIKGDHFRLYQLFQNLISNALKYIDKEEKIITIDCKDRNDFWEISIKDNGIGIDKKYHSKIFEVFQMLEESDESSGIGLSIVKKIVNFYGGKVWLASKLNEGTTFFFTLPK